MWYWTKILFLIFAGAVGVWLIYEVVTFPAISRLRTENPTTSSMIEYRLSEARANGTEPKKFMIWTPIEQISPNLQRAVMRAKTRISFSITVLTGTRSKRRGTRA